MMKFISKILITTLPAMLIMGCEAATSKYTRSATEGAKGDSQPESTPPGKEGNSSNKEQLSVKPSPSATPKIQLPPGAMQTATLFTHIGGFKLSVEFASSGLGLVTNDAGEAIKLVAGNHTYQQSMGIYDIKGKLTVGDTDINKYPVLTSERTLVRNTIFPNWTRHDLRDYFITSSNNGLDNRVCGVGRTYYNTNPQPDTEIHCTQMNNNFTVQGLAEKIPIAIPEQFVTGFGGAEDRFLGGAYDSGQGTTMGPVIAAKQKEGNWKILYQAPNLGDFTNTASPPLPRPLGYSCPEGNSWVCHEPVTDGKGITTGVWTTERIYGGGAEMGDIAMLLPSLGFGPRSYPVQSSTFGDPKLDKSYAYFFKLNASTGNYEFLNYDEWPFSKPGENVAGMKIGRLPGIKEPLLFVVRVNAWKYGLYMTGSVVDIFKINEK